MIRKFSVFLAAALTLAPALVFSDAFELSPEMQAAAARISANSLRGHLSFLASDALEGRGTPSRGLDLAAEYIAAQFRRAGLEPAGDDGYFQTAMVTTREQNPEHFEFTVMANGRELHVNPEQTVILPNATIDLKNVAIKQTARGVELGGIQLLSVREQRHSQTIDPEAPQRRAAVYTMSAPELSEFLKNASDARATLHVEPALEHSSKVRNVAGILRGSDANLAKTYVMLTAHYDHLGMRATGDDKIYNGANDDGSGTVSVIEIASAIAAANPHPKRSILFMTLFGEELGLVGSRYYARHPLAPLADTIADLNLEQIGRTDDSEGPQVGTATLTGFDFSTETNELVRAGELTGVKIYKNNRNSDPYFARSDNQALADAGVVAHTLCVAFSYPDYHGVGDEWQKVDYDNMVKIDRTVAVALMELASDEPAPNWNASNPKTKRYVDAAAKLHAK